MNTVVRFVPKVGRTARHNLDAFIALCRDELRVFGVDLDFDSNVWDATGWLVAKGRTHATRLRFSNWENATGKGTVTPMGEPFRSFAKAYVRYQQAWQPRASFSACLTTLRALERALLDTTGGRCPTEVNSFVLNRAATLLTGSLAASTAYSAGTELQVIAKFCADHALLAVPAQWRNPIKPPENKRTRVGKEFDEQRQKKMPSPAAFYALGHIYQAAVEPADILVSSVCALLCSAPSRIAEVVHLPSQCEVRQSDPRKGISAYGMRWHPAKDAAPMVKWVATPMCDIVQDALQKLRDLSAPAVALARWYEANPQRMYLPPELEHLRGKPDLSMRELSNILFVDDGKYWPSRSKQWHESFKVNTFKRGKGRFVAFDDVERVIVALLPKGFPVLDQETGLRYSESLMVLRRAELDPNKVTYGCMLQAVEPDDIASRIGKRAELNIFERHGFKEEDGSAIELTTHKFRHYLNTLAQSNNMDQLDLAKWSGRASVSQNKAYDHVSDRDATEKLRLALAGDAVAVGPIARLHKVALIPRDQFARLRVPTAHTTEYGYCVHDFAMLPCQSHQDCINCSEHACIKGDAVREKHVRSSLDETRLLLERARAAMNDEEFGADKWVDHHTLTLRRLESLCQIFDDPSVPAGAVIRLDDTPVASALLRAVDARALSSGGELPPLPQVRALEG
jgi:hypothetical protein